MLTDLMKIMLVDPDQKERENYRLATMEIPYFAVVFETGSEVEAVEFLETHAVDVLIMELELEEGDGIALLDYLTEMKLEKPFVAVVTNNKSDVLLSYVRERVDCVYKKDNRMYTPGKVLDVIERTYPYRKVVLAQQDYEKEYEYRREKEDYFKRQYIEDALVDMGFRRGLLGFTYIADAVMILMDYDGVTPRLTSEIYPDIAKNRNTSKESVERAIRHALESTFKRASKPQLRHFYPYRYNQKVGRPSNGEFLIRFARMMKL